MNLNNIAEVEMKKLALIVIIAALSTLMAAAITKASDERFDWWVLQGTYAMIAYRQLSPFDRRFY